jgi:hypothetical protein
MMTQTMPEKLELIAFCLKQGRDVECREIAGGGWFQEKGFFANGEVHVMGADYEYRAKPVKPRTTVVCACKPDDSPKDDYIAVELTPSVRQALEAAGIEI